ncbi:putative inorganic polyphosphate/ATP-NAD kinase [Luteitalea pratensis]|uniref:NAD kinase n=1 Tax=Luteitalea pratensis TaxID=1855912 RepID=A0A143PNB8_LUTPR|nr:NAD(+)/NADH kinase [Luteitalea pratensis]AMY09640.1 putative inorganic polyphosphate/ATP-NAD kinase [Luteitalea pratensis]
MTSPIHRVGLVAKPGLTEAADLLGEIGAWLVSRGIEPCYETDTASLSSTPLPGGICEPEQIGRHEQLIIVLGGDGTLLGTAGRLATSGFDVPVVAVNFGSLGFLTEVRVTEVYEALSQVLAGTAHEERRMMLESHVCRADGTQLSHISLNDVVITKGALSRMIDLVASADGQLIARFKADGLIVASPTGSTAYNLSAGGPIVHPGVDALVLTPIAPHTLTNRPVVLPASTSLDIVVAGEIARSSREETYVTFDGQVGDILGPGETVSIHRAPYALRLLKPSSHGYFQVLRQKLRWAER